MIDIEVWVLFDCKYCVENEVVVDVGLIGFMGRLVIGKYWVFGV